MSGATASAPTPVGVFTGAAGGLGLACALRLAGGGPIVLADIDGGRLETTAAEARKRGIDAVAVSCDVTDSGSVLALAARARELGPLGVLVHAAGVAPPLAEDPRRTLEVNLGGTARLLDAFAPVAGRDTVAVCIASLGGHRRGVRRFDALLDDPLAADLFDRVLEQAGGALSVLAAYALSKRGVIRLCEQRAAAWGKHGARLISVSPGLVADTTIGVAAMTIQAGAYAEQSALGRAGVAADIAAAVAAITATDNTYLTGCDVLVDGGVLAAINHHGSAEAAAEWHACGLGLGPGDLGSA